MSPGYTPPPHIQPLVDELHAMIALVGPITDGAALDQLTSWCEINEDLLGLSEPNDATRIVVQPERDLNCSDSDLMERLELPRAKGLTVQHRLQELDRQVKSLFEGGGEERSPRVASQVSLAASRGGTVALAYLWEGIERDTPLFEWLGAFRSHADSIALLQGSGFWLSLDDWRVLSAEQRLAVWRRLS